MPTVNYLQNGPNRGIRKAARCMQASPRALLMNLAPMRPRFKVLIG